MAKRKSINNGSDAKYAAKHLFGKSRMSNVIKNSIGLNFGFKKLIRLDNYAKFQDIANPNLNEFGDIG